MKPKHTPGPWIVSNIPDDRIKNFVWVIDPNSDLGICKVHTDGDTKDESEANARLIAAAPDLVSAAMRILELWDNNGNPAGAFQALRSAIEKATLSDTQRIRKALIDNE